jgi:hypothetical protein
MTAAAVFLIALFSPNARAQDEPLFEQLVGRIKSKPFNIGLLMQTVADFQPERSQSGYNGFSIANFRLSFYGELDEGFSYFVQTNFVRSPSFLETRFTYSVAPEFTVDAGVYKPPFSKEFLTSESAIDFVNRSQAVSQLSPGRQIGMQARGRLADKMVSYAVGMFNGNPFTSNINDNNDFIYLARLALFPPVPENQMIEIGISAAHSNDADVSVLGTGFSGKRLLLGADARLTIDDFLLSGEVVRADLKQTAAATVKPFGYQATIGCMITSKSQLLGRWDFFRADGLAPDAHLIVLGYNLWPTKATELQVNYLVPTKNGNIRHHQLLVNAQIAF